MRRGADRADRMPGVVARIGRTARSGRPVRALGSALGSAWIAVFAFALAIPGAAGAAEFREVASAAAVLYDAPSERARKLFIVSRGTPLEVVSAVAGWVKVRDLGGDVLWIEHGELTDSRHVVANTLAAVRKAPQPQADLLVQVERGVLLEIVDRNAPDGWVHVRHRDGVTGFVQALELWGR